MFTCCEFANLIPTTCCSFVVDLLRNRSYNQSTTRQSSGVCGIGDGQSGQERTHDSAQLATSQYDQRERVSRQTEDTEDRIEY